MSLEQREFEYLIALKKEFKHTDVIDLASVWSREIHSIESKDKFILDYNRNVIKLEKYTYNKRYRTSIILIRFDSSGRHTNPGGKRFDGPHVHIFREGYDAKFAFPVSEIGINENNLEKADVLDCFLKYCNVANRPSIQPALI